MNVAELYNIRKNRVIAGVVSAILFLLVFMIFLLPNSSADGKARIVTIPRGASFHAAVDSLESSGLLRSRLLFDVAARLMGKRSSIKAGKYKFESGVSNYTLLYDLDKGEYKTVTVGYLNDDLGTGYALVTFSSEEVITAGTTKN